MLGSALSILYGFLIMSLQQSFMIGIIIIVPILQMKKIGTQ